MSRPVMHPRRSGTISRVLLSLAAMAACQCLPQTARGIETPYADQPAAFCTSSSSLLWDQQFASSLGNVGNQYIILDFCHSGGFVGNLMAGTSANRFVAAACQWREYSYNAPGFGKTFWEKVQAGETIHDAYSDAYMANLPKQEGMAASTGAAGLEDSYLPYKTGDMAFIYASDPIGYRGADAAAACLAAKGWDPLAVTVLKRTITATDMQDIYDATSNVNRDGCNTIIYLDDHGTSTDVVRSRHIGSHYQYDFTGSTGRFAATNKYGISDLYTGIVDLPFPNWPSTSAGDYTNVEPPMPGWHWQVEGDKVHWFAPDRNDPNTWLVPGNDYNFGFDCPLPETIVGWESYVNIKFPGAPNDTGSPVPIGVGLGTGDCVWLQNAAPAPDPNKWPGWDNGGDGWIQVPIPEPATLTLLALGGLAVLRRRK